MARLTDRGTAEVLRSNVEELKKAGIEPSIEDLRYIKLADYENEEEWYALQLKEWGGRNER
ncbi:MAG TPA: hypothetical protein P5191_09135 [Ruminococcus sp.]|mgnify:CR=1 FL=1|nr:hypothetical protein [Ruminococcus sp.]